MQDRQKEPPSISIPIFNRTELSLEVAHVWGFPCASSDVLHWLLSNTHRKYSTRPIHVLHRQRAQGKVDFPDKVSRKR